MSINTSGNPPHPSAGLDVDFNDRGMLIPRMTESQRDSIQSPANGLLIFNTTSNCINMWSGSTWRQSCFECDFQNPIVSNSGPVCEGDSLFLSSSTIAGATYSWTGPNGFSSSSQNPNIPNTTTSATGTYDLVVTVNGCSSSPVSTQATVIPVPNAPVPGSNSPVCSGDSIFLTASTINGASYAWTGPNGYSSSLQNPFLANVSSSNAGSYSVTATVNGCTSPAANTSVTVNTTPNAPVAGSNSPVIVGDSIHLTASTVAGATYSWSGPNAFSSTMQNPSIANGQVATHSGLYEVVSIANGCTSAVASTTVTVIDPPYALFSASGTFTVPAGVTSVRVIAIGGGGGGANGHAGGGGSGRVNAGTFSVSPGQNIAVTVGTGGSGALQTFNSNSISGVTSGGTSVFGGFLNATGGNAASSSGGSGGSGGGGGCNGGSPGGNGGSGGSAGINCNTGNGSGQGGTFTSFFPNMLHNTVTSGSGGVGGVMSHSGGGGGGGILINSLGPTAQDGNNALSGKGGQGYGAGGGAGGYDSPQGGTRWGGGDGADGAVYIEW